MKKPGNNYQLIWILLAVVVVMAIIKIKYGWKGEVTAPLPENLIPTETVTVIPTEVTVGATVLKVDETKYPLWQELPYSGDGFLIDKYAAPKVLAVQLNGATRLQATTAINVWLKSFGDAGKGHKIEFEN